jgi:Holliday junction DNA helicase RuvA
LIASLKGVILFKNRDTVVIDVSGVGYQVNLSAGDMSNLPEVGSYVFIHTHTYVREDALQLFGFLSSEDKEAFMTLIKISGIGPKLGLGILSAMPAAKLSQVIHNEEVNLLCTIPGLGKKTASRIVLELKEKLPTLTQSHDDPSVTDAKSALVNLGYKKADVELAVKKSVQSGAKSLESIIKKALQYLTNG